MIPFGQWLAQQPRLEFALPAAGFVAAEGMAAAGAPGAGGAEEARAAGEAAGRAAAEAEFAEREAQHAAALEALRGEAEVARAQAVALARETWCAEQAELMETKLADAFAALEQDLSRAIAACLAPFLEERTRQLAVDEFGAALKTLAGQEALVRLEAPADLIAALKARPGGLPGGIDAQVADHGDLLATAGGTLIESALARWLATVREAAA